MRFKVMEATRFKLNWRYFSHCVLYALFLWLAVQINISLAKTIRVLCRTWNANGIPPTPEIAKCLLQESEESSNSDVVVIALQEIIPLDRTVECLKILTLEKREEKWELCISKAMEDVFEKGYIKLVSHHLLGIALFIYVKEELNGSIDKTRVLYKDISCGVKIIKSLGNKGAVAVQFRVGSNVLCFYSCHLAAHFGKVQERNENMRKILHEPCEFDHVLVLGDLNYRVKANTDLNEVKDFLKATREKIKSGESPLLSTDETLTPRFEEELSRNLQDKDSVWFRFNEAGIRFLPTYKVHKDSKNRNGEDIYDLEKRFPAWCDRALWTGRLKINVTTYFSRREPAGSDHLAVDFSYVLELDDQDSPGCKNVTEYYTKTAKEWRWIEAETQQPKQSGRKHLRELTKRLIHPNKPDSRRSVQ